MVLKCVKLVGLYLPNQLKDLIPIENAGLYRDDGLAFIRSRSGRLLDRYRKDIIELFRREGLSITCETNLSVTDYLDVTFNMETGKYTPFRKDNNTPLYINVKSNHPTLLRKKYPKWSKAASQNFQAMRKYSTGRKVFTKLPSKRVDTPQIWSSIRR